MGFSQRSVEEFLECLAVEFEELLMDGSVRVCLACVWGMGGCWGMWVVCGGLCFGVFTKIGSLV